MPEGSWDIRVLGPLWVGWQGLETDLGSPQARSMFAVLLLSANQPVTWERIADDLWDEHPPATAKTQIHGLISRVRRALPRPLITTRRSGYVLELSPEALDIQRFTTLTATARELMAQEQLEQGTRLMNDALGLWRGPALPDIPVPSARMAADRWDDL